MLFATKAEVAFRSKPLRSPNLLVAMSLPCSDQSIRPKKTKDATLPSGVKVLRCWCGSPCKVKESTDFSDKMGMRFFMCPNYEHDPPAASSPYVKPPVCFNIVELSYCFNIYEHSNFF